MNKIKTLIIAGGILALALGAQAQTVITETNASGGTTTITNPVPVAPMAVNLSTIIGSGGWQSAVENGVAYLENTGTTNGIITTEAGVLLGNKKDVGGFLDVYLPIGGTNSAFGAGFGVAYLNHQFYDATLNARLGETYSLPFIKIPVYAYVESGGGYNIGSQQVIAQAFAGGLITIPITASWTATVGAAMGTISDYSGNVLAAGASLTWKF